MRAEGIFKIFKGFASIIPLALAFFVHSRAELYFYSKSWKREITTPPAPSPVLFRISAMGNDGAVAMGLWLQLLPYMGELYLNKEFYKKGDFPFIAGSVSTIVEIDPYFYDAILVGVNVLPRLPGYLDESLKIGEKGTRSLSQRWDIPFFTGFNYWRYKGNKEKALEYFKISSRRPKVPTYVPGLAAIFMYEKGEYEKMKEFYSRIILDRNYPEVFKEIFKLEYKNINNLLELQKALNTYKKVYEKIPESLEELVSAGLIDKIPEEPFGGRYYIEKDKGIVRTSSEFKGYFK